MRKFISVILALAMAVTSALVCSSAVYAIDDCSYNSASNSIVIEAADGKANIDNPELLSSASEYGAAAVTVNASKSKTLELTFSDSLLSGISKGGYSVRVILSGAKLYFDSAAIGELGEKTSQEAKIKISVGDTLDIFLTADGEKAVLDIPFAAVREEDTDGKNSVVSDGKATGLSYVEDGKWSILVNSDIKAECVAGDVPAFDDTDTHWARENVSFVASKGFFNGVEKGKFSPDGKMTRAMAVTVLSRIDGFSGGSGAYPYSDVSADAWFAPAVTWAFENGIIESSDSFRPDDNITRIELIRMIYNFSKKLGINTGDFGSEELNFTDGELIKDEESRLAVLYCTENGIVGGYTTSGGKVYLKPDGNATRAEVAAIIQRFVKSASFGGTDTMKGKYAKFINARGDLANVYKKISEKKKLNVAYFGGSVTDGYGASNAGTTSWRGLVHSYLKKTFPDADIAMNSAGVGGSGSHLGAFRVQTDIIPQNPDLVFIEFSVNDGYSGTVADGDVTLYFESIVRQIREAHPECEIIAVYVTDSGKAQKYGDSKMNPASEAQEKVCELYGITSIDVGRALVHVMGGYSESVWKQYVKDSVHPLDAGYAVYADVIKEYLGEYLTGESSFAYGETKAHSLPDGYADERNAAFAPRYIPINSLDIFDSIEGFTLYPDSQFLSSKTKGYILPTSEKNQFTFTFNGTGLDMFLVFKGGNYYYEYSIDGSEPKKVWIVSSNHPFKFLRGLEPGEHTVTYSYLGRSGEGETSTERSIGGFMVHGTK